jgi:hypothetical protein
MRTTSPDVSDYLVGSFDLGGSSRLGWRVRCNLQTEAYSCHCHVSFWVSLFFLELPYSKYQVFIE